VLQKANGVIATVGLEADLSQEAPAPAPPTEMPAADQPPAAPDTSPADQPPDAPGTPAAVSPATRDH
jgi:hypothetical protein